MPAPAAAEVAPAQAAEFVHLGVERGPYGHAVIGDRMVFEGFDETSGGELWVTDGTPAGTRMVKDINPGPIGSSPWN
ncbi:MAG: hypothetical protein HKN24_01425, partial [Acidimicrobiales bacterium]|nr:hypothetical protein [Acidimicrobiales bacterium]